MRFLTKCFDCISFLEHTISLSNINHEFEVALISYFPKQIVDPVTYSVEDVSPSALRDYFFIVPSSGVLNCLKVDEGDEEAERASLEGGKATVVVRAENSGGEDLAAVVASA